MSTLLHLENLTLTENFFQLIDPELAQKGGKLDVSLEADVLKEDGDQVIVKAEMKIFGNTDTNTEEIDLFCFSSKHTAKFKVANADEFQDCSEEFKMQIYLTLVYPYVRENALKSLRDAELGMIQLPFSYQ